MAILIEVPPGELLDKLTILEIKESRIADETKRRNVRNERVHLESVRSKTIPKTDVIEQLFSELLDVNRALWVIEDRIRGFERNSDFGPRFIELARSVYHQNDRRALIKREINLALSSELIEEKSYAA